MNKLSFIAVLALILATIVSFSSCKVTETLNLKSSISENDSLNGNSHIDLSVSNYFVSVVEDLSNWEENGNNDPILQVAVDEFVQNLEASDSASSIRFIKTGINTYMGDFSFSDFNNLVLDLSQSSSSSLVNATEIDGKTHVQIHIGMDNYEELTKVIPFLANPNFEVYGPLYNHDLTEENYLEMMSFILGEECPDEILNSKVTIQVVAPKEITSHNGTLKNAKTVVFSFPLIDFLLLHEPIEFELEY